MYFNQNLICELPTSAINWSFKIRLTTSLVVIYPEHLLRSSAPDALVQSASKNWFVHPFLSLSHMTEYFPNDHLIAKRRVRYSFFTRSIVSIGSTESTCSSDLQYEPSLTLRIETSTHPLPLFTDRDRQISCFTFASPRNYAESNFW